MDGGATAPGIPFGFIDPYGIDCNLRSVATLLRWRSFHAPSRLWNIPYGATWSQITPSGVLPGERHGQAAVYQGAGHVLIAGGRWYTSPAGDPDQSTGPGHSSGIDIGTVGKLALNIEQPTRSQARIHVSLDGDPDNPTLGYAMDAYDVAGRLVRHWDVRGIVANGGQAFWDMNDNRGSPLPAGIYFVRLKDQKSSITQRMVALH